MVPSRTSTLAHFPPMTAAALGVQKNLVRIGRATQRPLWSSEGPHFRTRVGLSRFAAVGEEAKSVPVPVVKIDNIHDPFATVVHVEFGDELEDLLDTARALKNLSLNIKRAKIDPAHPDTKHKFYVTDLATSEKITKSERLEKIRYTILENLTRYHPNSISQLEVGHPVNLPETRDETQPLGPKQRFVVDTTIDIEESANGTCSEVYVRTKDRPGLLVDIVAVLKDLNVNVVSAEVDTVGAEARDEFYVTYHGEPLSASMQKLVENCLQYYLSLQEVETQESY